MTVVTRMRRIIGDQNTAARYYLEKIGHTALIAIALHALGVPLYRAGLEAAIAYLVLSKLVDRVDYHDWGTFWRDGAFYRRLVFIAVTLALVPILALADVIDRRYMPILVLAWALVWLVVEGLGWEEAPR